MPPEAIDILQRALDLPVDTRAELNAQLLQTLEGDDGDVEAEWNAEIARRVAELDSGAVKTVPWEQARKQIRGKPHRTDRRSAG